MVSLSDGSTEMVLVEQQKAKGISVHEDPSVSKVHHSTVVLSVLTTLGTP
jgi:hypothetical protein